ncbi:MFS transporter [Pseudomonas sp. P1.8]|uniref:MFS transporter n=1 Tax=Pseudomonas sp. P1.8 TaxID=1699310 RepID=UPI00069DB53B|nr:MFS transporter [Pseudomonas sp. P1.8]
MSSSTGIQVSTAQPSVVELPHRGQAYYTVSVLLIAYIFSIMDRQILTLLVGPIQQSLQVNDSWMGVLHGFTFAAFYSLVGLPIARLIDRGNRRLVIAIGIGLWCLATAAGGLANEFWHLLLARIGVAVGEAVLLPGAVSLISDLFTPEKRGRALGVFGTGASFGAGAGLLATGLVLGYFTAHPLTLPGLGLLQPWQTTLMSIGLPGLLVLVLMIGVAEPRLRKNALGVKPVAQPQVPLREVLAYLRENRRTFVAIFVGAGCFYTAVYGSGSWVPTFLVREFGWTYARVGALMGAIMCVCGPLGVIIASWLGEHWRNRGVANANLRIALIASVLLALVSAPLLMASSIERAIPFLALAATLWTCLFGVGAALIVEVAPASMRGQFMAMFTGALSLLGAGCGPVLVGMLTDYAFKDPHAIKYSILYVVLFGCGLAALLFFSAWSSLRHTAQKALQWEAERLVHP